MVDRIHIVSYPGPDRSISEKSIEDKNMIARKYRNRRIGEFLKELKLTEGRNTGIPKIKRALKNNGSKEPIFETNETRDYFITTIFMHSGFEDEILNKTKISDKTSDKTSDKILNYLNENEFITTTIASKLIGLSTQRTRAILGKMAKEEVKVADITKVSAENIEEVINNGSTVTEDVAKAAAEKIAKQRKEELTERHIDVTLKSEYTRLATYLSMKKTDKEKEVKLNYLKKFSEKDDKLRNGGITIEDYLKDCKELYKEANNLLREVDKWYQEQQNKLLNQYPKARYDWRWDGQLLSL